MKMNTATTYAAATLVALSSAFVDGAALRNLGDVGDYPSGASDHIVDTTGWFAKCPNEGIVVEACGADPNNSDNWCRRPEPCERWCELYSTAGCSDSYAARQTGDWTCGASGENIECPAGQALTGSCGWTCNDDTKCNSDAAILCGVMDDLYEAVDTNHWLDPSGPGEYQACPDDEVACGRCVSSDENEMCDGTKESGTSRLKCCPVRQCKASSVTGRWVPIKTSNAREQTVKFHSGTSRDYVQGSSEEWGTSVKATVSQSFGFEAVGVSSETSLSVTTGASHTMAESYGASFRSDSWTENSDTFGPGTVWQWQFSARDPCGDSTTAKSDLRLTPAAAYPPCCLPGFEKNLTNPHESCCHPDTDGVVYDMCTHSNAVRAPCNVVGHP